MEQSEIPFPWLQGTNIRDNRFIQVGKSALATMV